MPHAMDFLHNIGNTSHPCPLCPSINIDSQAGGGQPESRSKDAVRKLKQQPLHFLSMHYQGGSKKMLAFDVCRILLVTIGIEKIAFIQVKQHCVQLVDKYGKSPGYGPAKNTAAYSKTTTTPIASRCRFILCFLGGLDKCNYLRNSRDLVRRLTGLA